MSKPEKPRDTVLVVDDDEEIRTYFSRLLRQVGIDVETAADGAEAVQVLATHKLQAIVSDINMPVYTGLEFLRAVRERDLDVPVILVTGQPDVQTAIDAVEYGAFRYLVKPVDGSELIETVRRACEMHRVAKLRREAWQLLGKQGPGYSDRASLETRYQVALSTLFLEFQPIVRPSDRSVLGYEAFARSSEPTLQLPGELFDAAWRLGSVHVLGRAVRKCVVEAAASAPEQALLFVNLHPEELNDNELWSKSGALTPLAERVVLEITERSTLDGVSGLKTRLRMLREMGFRTALDDLGSGHAALGNFSRIEPDFVKLDRVLIADVDSSERRLAVIKGIADICNGSLGMQVIAEGVETPNEQAALSQIGLSLFQGHHFSRPKRGFANPWAN